MENIEYYMSLPFDTGGSLAKNRFRYELLWGLKRILKIHDEVNDYVAVFDYCCDVEIHTDTHYEFYQLKTRNKVEVFELKKLRYKSNGKSIYGKLYKLKLDADNHEVESTKIAVVSNIPLSDGCHVYTSNDFIRIDSIEINELECFKKAIIEELGIEDISLDNAFYLNSSLNLHDPRMEIIGELVLFVEEKLGEEIIKPSTLYRVLSEVISSKACNEEPNLSYNELIEKKGLSKKMLINIVSKHIQIADNAIEKATQYIYDSTEGNFLRRIDLKKILGSLLVYLKTDTYIQGLEKLIASTITENLSTLNMSIDEAIVKIENCLDFKIPIDVSKDDIYVLIVIVLHKYMEGAYE